MCFVEKKSTSGYDEAVCFFDDFYMPSYRCPITLEIVKVPVITNRGNVYDFVSIATWLLSEGGKNRNDPLTREVIDILIYNRPLLEVSDPVEPLTPEEKNSIASLYADLKGRYFGVLTVNGIDELEGMRDKIDGVHHERIKEYLKAADGSKDAYILRHLRCVRDARQILNYVVQEGFNKGMSLALVLAFSSEGMKLLVANNHRLAGLISEATLNHVIQEGANKGLSLALLLASFSEGRNLLAANNHPLAGLISEATLNHVVQEGPNKEKSLALALAYSSEGMALLAANNHRLAGLISEAMLNHVIQEGPNKGMSLALALASSSEGMALLAANNYRLAGLISEAILTQVIRAGPNQGKSITSLLTANGWEGVERVEAAEAAVAVGILEPKSVKRKSDYLEENQNKKNRQLAASSASSQGIFSPTDTVPTRFDTHAPNSLP